MAVALFGSAQVSLSGLQAAKLIPSIGVVWVKSGGFCVGIEGLFRIIENAIAPRLT